ncbi:MAG: hypothetical protein AAFN92_02430 [Bacteroidota bacterium]
MRTFTTACLLVLLALGCQKYTVDNLPAEHLRFGTKGGVTGGGREYVLLLDSGRLLFDGEYSDELEKVGKLTKAELTAVRADLTKIDFSAKSLPNNYTTSLVYHHDGAEERLAWRRPGDAPSPVADECYDHLMAAVRRLRKTDRD